MHRNSNPPKDVTCNVFARLVCCLHMGIAGMQMAAVIYMSNDSDQPLAGRLIFVCGPEQAIFDM
jgi:hypothetical protein